MATATLEERYAANLHGVLLCFDRIMITGTLPGACYAEGMTSFFKHHRKVEHRDRHVTRELAPLKKTSYSLIGLREILLGCNQRYLAFLSSLEDPSAGERDLQRLSQPRVGTDPSVKGLNFCDASEQTLLRTLQLGIFNIHGWRRADLLTHLNISPSAMSRQLKRLHLLGLIKKVAHTYRYYLTRMGRAAIAAGTLVKHTNSCHACSDPSDVARKLFLVD